MRKPDIHPKRAVEVFETMVDIRRNYCDHNAFFKMTTFWEDMQDESGNWRIKRFESGLGEDYVRNAKVIQRLEKATLLVSQELWDHAESGVGFPNFILAHEAAHLGLNHHRDRAVIKNFVLFSKDTNMLNVPPTLEEFEANLGAVFLQCGIALGNPMWNAFDLARRACSDLDSVKKAQMYLRTPVFQKFLRPTGRHLQRVIL